MGRNVASCFSSPMGTVQEKGGFHHYKRMSQSFTFTHSVNTHGPLTVLGTASHQGECVYGWERNAKERELSFKS